MSEQNYTLNVDKAKQEELFKRQLLLCDAMLNMGVSSRWFTIARTVDGVYLAEQDRNPEIHINILNMTALIEHESNLRHVILRGWEKILENGGFKVSFVVKPTEQREKVSPLEQALRQAIQ